MRNNFLKLSLILMTFFSLLLPIQIQATVDYFYEDPTDVTKRHATAAEFLATLSQDSKVLIEQIYGVLRPQQRDSLFRHQSFHTFLNALPDEHRNTFIFLMNRDEECETKLKRVLTVQNLMAYSTFQRVINSNIEETNQAYDKAEKIRVHLEGQQRIAFFQAIFDGSEDLARHAIRVWIKGTWSYDQQLPTVAAQWSQNFLAELLGNHDVNLAQRKSMLEKLDYAMTTLRQNVFQYAQPVDDLSQATPITIQIRKILSRSSLLYLEMLTTLKNVYSDPDLAPEAKAQKFNGVFTECSSLAIAIQGILKILTAQAQQATQ